MSEQKRRRWLTSVIGCLLALTLCGCYSTARHVANIRPALVKPMEGISERYRVDRLLVAELPYLKEVRKLNENRDELLRQQVLRFRQQAAQNGDSTNEIVNSAVYRQLQSLAVRNDLNRVVSELEARHNEDSQKIKQLVEMALLEHYPSVFTRDSDAIPLTILVNWSTTYKGHPNYASILKYWFWPLSADQETVYRIRIVKNAGGRSDSDLWQEFFASIKSYPQPAENASAVRMSEVWETMLLPIGFIPVPGESDWSKTFCFMRQGKDSLVGSPAEKIRSKNCIRDMVFEPKVDGEVIAAAIMRSINRQFRVKQVNALVGEGGLK